MNSRVRALAVCLALPACGAFDACLDHTREPIVYVDVVDRVSEGEGVELPRARLESGARRIMDSWSDFGFRNKKADEVGWQLDLQVGLATERTADPVGEAPADPNRVHRAVGVGLELRSLGAVERSPSRISAEVLLTRDEARSVPFGDLAEDAVLEAGRRLERAMTVYWGDDEDILVALAAEQDWLRTMGAEAAGVRKLAGAVEPLMARVRDTDEAEDVRIRAVGALVEIGDPRAAAAVIDACRQKNAGYLVQMIFALGQIGGREAEGYLFTVASGYPVPEVRAAAKSALEELERRRAEAKRPGEDPSPSPP